MNLWLISIGIAVISLCIEVLIIYLIDNYCRFGFVILVGIIGVIGCTLVIHMLLITVGIGGN